MKNKPQIIINTKEPWCQEDNALGLVNKASSLGSGVGKLGWRAESATKPSELIRQGRELPSLSGAGGALSHYKELHAKGYNYVQNGGKLPYHFGCGAKSCLYALCTKKVHLECEAYIWVAQEFERLKTDSAHPYIGSSEVVHKPIPYREQKNTIDEQKALLKWHYIGFGAEAQNCGRWGMLKECERGHKVVKRLVCGREWCPICGERGSDAHNRRIARLIDRVFAMDVVGYLVIELPLAVRRYAEDVTFLREFRRYIVRMLERELGTRGIARWHYCGDDGCTYKPHLNVLIEHAYIGKKQLRRLRRLCSKWLKKRLDKQAYRVAPLHYNYTRKEGKIWHWLSYITRATLTCLTDSNRQLASELYGFNNVSWFGTFGDEDKQKGRERFEAYVKTLTSDKKGRLIDIKAHDAWYSGLCPVCGAQTALVDGVVQVHKYEVLTDYGGGLLYVSDMSRILPGSDEDVLLGGGVKL